MRKLCMFLFTLPALCLLVGCFGYTQNDNEWRVSFESALSIKQIGPKDVNLKAVVGIGFEDWMQKPLVDWIVANQQSPNNEVVVDLNN